MKQNTQNGKNHIYNDTKYNQKNIKEAANYIRTAYTYLLIIIDVLFLRPSLHFTTLHSTSLHLSTLHFFPFKLHPATLHYPLIWLNPI